MNESLQELENELKALPPRRASTRWLDRINRDLAAELPVVGRTHRPGAAKPSPWQWPGWRTVGLAAALALVAAAGLIRVPRTPPEAPSPVATAYEPVAAKNVLYDLQDEGVVQVDGDTASRQVRARYVDTYTWKNPGNNASIKWTVPRDEVRVVQASYNPN